MFQVLTRGVVGLVFLALGVVGLVSPATTRNVISGFIEKTPVRILGFVLMVVGAGIFRLAAGLYFPLAGQLVGVALFMAGGVHIFIPDFAIVLNEWWVARKAVWERLVSVAYVLLAALLFMPQEGVSWPQRREHRIPPEYWMTPAPPTEQPAAPPENRGEAPDAPHDES